MINKNKSEFKIQKNRGEISFGMEILLFVLAIFIIWVLVGEPRTENYDKPFIKGQSVIVR